MTNLEIANAAELDAGIGEILATSEGLTCFEELAQRLCQGLYQRYPDEIALVRCYVTVPLSELPSTNAQIVRDLALTHDVALELHDDTPVISLVGTAGRDPAWNDRRRSRGHQALPMVSASFIETIPMMARLMRSISGDLGWIDEFEQPHVIERLGTLSGTFYVADAATEVDGRGRAVIPATEFVERHGVVSVLGTGGGFSTGQIVTLVIFCTRAIPRAVAEGLRDPMLRWKARAAPLLARVFHESPLTPLLAPTRPTEAMTTAGPAGPAAAPMAPITPTSEPTAPVAARAKRAGRPAPKPAVSAPVGQVGAEPRADRLAVTLEARTQELEQVNRLYLQLEADLEERTRSLRTILDATSDGFLLVDLDGSLCGETNAAIERWFGPRSPRAKLWDYLFDATNLDRVTCAVCYLQISDQILPFEMAADQMPQRFARGGRTFSMSYRPVNQLGRLAQVLVVIRDVTAELEAARAEQRARELHAITANMLRDRRGFARFVEETGESLARLMSSSDTVAQRRDLHTIKGTTAVYGLQTFAALAHQLEQELATDDHALDREARGKLHEAWRRELATLADLTEVHLESTIEISPRELDDFVEKLKADGTARSLVTHVQRWRHEPVRLALQRLGMQARRVGERVGKPVEVAIVDGGLRLPMERTRPIWSALIHVVRNSVDHGIEAPDRRAALGKPSAGQLTLASAVTADQWTVTVTDDGAGVDWDEVRRKAAAAGMPARNESELTEVLFRDGFTTREGVSELSGRGVGLAALRAACRALGGEVQLDSRRGQGTTIHVALPIGALAA
jgi:signal transduction histidine kinase